MIKLFKLLLLCFLVVFTMVTCTPESEQTVSGTFKIVVAPNHFTYGMGIVAIYTKEGQLLTQQEVQNNQTYLLDVYNQPSIARFNVLFFKLDSLELSTLTMKNYNIDYYLDISPCTIYRHNANQSHQYSPLAQMEVSISGIDVSSYDYLTVASSFNSMGYSTNQFMVDQWVDNDGYLFKLVKGSEVPLYCFVPNVGLNESIQLTADDFIPMTGKTIQFPSIDPSFIQINSKDNVETAVEEYYPLYYAEVSGMDKQLIYYPENIFPGYRVNFVAYNDYMPYSYLSISDQLPDFIPSPESTFTFVNSSIRSFKADITGSIDYLMGWTNKEIRVNESLDKILSILVYGSKEAVSAFSFPNLPVEVTNIDTEFLSGLDTLTFDAWVMNDADYLDNYDDYFALISSELNKLPENYTVCSSYFYAPDTKKTNTLERIKKQLAKIPGQQSSVLSVY